MGFIFCLNPLLCSKSGPRYTLASVTVNVSVCGGGGGGLQNSRCASGVSHVVCALLR
jgi:hypothetical protein